MGYVLDWFRDGLTLLALAIAPLNLGTRIERDIITPGAGVGKHYMLWRYGGLATLDDGSTVGKRSKETQ